MSIRTDLAIEKEDTKNLYKTSEETVEKIKITRLEKGNEKYVTIEFESLDKIAEYDTLEEEIIKGLRFVVGSVTDNVLVAGLGNTEITPDSIGPLTANKILATRHIAGNFAEKIGLKNLKSVAVISPSVLGKTGIETAEIIKGIKDKISPDFLIVIDALASSSISRLFCSVQISNQGISPGSGVKNSRQEISEKTFNIPVIAIGVPTVVDAKNLANELTGEKVKKETDMILTPKDADLLSHRMSEIIARSLNVFLQPETEKEWVLALV